MIEAALNSEWLKIKEACSEQSKFSQYDLTLDYQRKAFPGQHTCVHQQVVFIECLLCAFFQKENMSSFLSVPYLVNVTDSF